MDLDRFAAYHQQTEEMIAFLLERAVEDETLARAMRRPWIWRVATFSLVKVDVAGYREAVQHVFDGEPGIVRQYWLLMARTRAFQLRREAGVHRDREGFNPAWLRAPTP